VNDRQALEDFIAEQFGVVVVEGSGAGSGPVTLIGLVHHTHSGDVPVHAMSSRQGGAAWGKPEMMASTFDALSTRHARGVVSGGAQQFSLNVCRGESGKPTATLPFVRASAPAVAGAGGYGGIASEPPNATGALAQVQRLMESLITGAFAQIQHVTTTQASLVDKLSTRLDTQEKRSDERWLALQNLLLQWQQQSVGLQLRALGVEAGRKLLPLLPAALSTLTGSDKLIPQAEVENSLFDALLENQSPAQLQEMLSTLSGQPGGGPLTAILADHLLRARKRKAGREREHAELVGSTAGSYEDGEADAAGVALRALAGQPAGARHANGHANGTTTHAPAKTSSGNGMMPGDAMLDVMLSSLSDSEIDQVAMLFAAKRPDQPGLADEIKSRYARLKGA
jgi:hypothetical protein